MLYGLQSIHQTDWQGRVELSSEPRTNYVGASNDFSQWVAGAGSTVGSQTGPSPDGGTNLTTLLGSGAAAAQMYWLQNITTAGDYRLSAVIAKGTSIKPRIGQFNGIGNGWAGFVDIDFSGPTPTAS